MRRPFPAAITLSIRQVLEESAAEAVACKPGQQWNGKHSEQNPMRGHSKGTGSVCFSYLFVCRVSVPFLSLGLDSKLPGEIQA